MENLRVFHNASAISHCDFSSPPLAIGEAASTFCMNCVKKKIEPMVPRFIRKPTLEAVLKVRTVKSFSSIMV